MNQDQMIMLVVAFLFGLFFKQISGQVCGCGLVEGVTDEGANNEENWVITGEDRPHCMGNGDGDDAGVQLASGKLLTSTNAYYCVCPENSCLKKDSTGCTKWCDNKDGCFANLQEYPHKGPQDLHLYKKCDPDAKVGGDFMYRSKSSTA